MNRKLYEDRYFILDFSSSFNCNSGAVSQSKHKVLVLVESKSTEVFEGIHTNIGAPFLHELYSRSKDFLTVIDDFSYFSWVCFLQLKLDTFITVHIFLNHSER
jgi:hypothetical protein